MLTRLKSLFYRLEEARRRGFGSYLLLKRHRFLSLEEPCKRLEETSGVVFDCDRLEEPL